MSNELRIRAIADVAQAKAAIQSLNAADANRLASVAKAAAESKKQEADLLQIQLNNAKATKASADEVKRLAAAYATVTAEARVAAGEARVLERASRAAARDAQRQVLPMGQGQAGAPVVVDKSGKRAQKFAFSRLGVGEGMLSEGGGINVQGLMAGLAAAITAAVTLGFKRALENQREAQKELGASARTLAEAQDEIVRAGKEVGASDADITKILSRVSGLRGVSSSTELARAALQGIQDGGTQGALEAINEASQGVKPITRIQELERERRTAFRELEIRSMMTAEDSLSESNKEMIAKQRRTIVDAGGGSMNAAFVLTGGVTQDLAMAYGGQQGALAATENLGSLTTRGSRFRSPEIASPQRVEVVNIIEARGPRRLGGD